ncbi:sulfotransferase family protein, partial [Gordonia rhizosphera]
PEITDLPITPPIVIAGLQRSGTTMLHRLIGADPQMRSVGSWEVVHVLPRKHEKPGKPTVRIAQTRLAEWSLRYLNPQFFAIHAVEADGPEEDVLLQEYSLLSQVPEAMLTVPSYADWLAHQDMHGSYAYLKTLLQVLAFQNPRPRWVLKTPAHLEHLDTLLDVFPDAVIVQTHRDPLRTTASFSSMLAHGHSMFSDHVDAEAVARHWLRRNGDMVDRALDVRAIRPDVFLDVRYDDLIDDPMAQVERIYAAAGFVLTDSTRSRMEEHRAGHAQNAHGVHRYTLEEFGIREAEVNAVYARYRAAFDL